MSFQPWSLESFRLTSASAREKLNPVGESASEEEDALTGDFCGFLRTEWREVQAPDGRWRWKVQYKKFRGRGDGALENHIGADGVDQVEVHTPSGVVVTKGVLFQAKKVRGSSRSDLREQVDKMERAAAGARRFLNSAPTDIVRLRVP